MITMPNEPGHAKEKRAPHTRRQNAQGDHEGSAHDPEEFDVMNPQKQAPPDRDRTEKAKVPPEDR
ncbi:MAG: hypothetical protein ACK4RZ_03585 [Paracoccaceae bacterium]